MVLGHDAPQEPKVIFWAPGNTLAAGSSDGPARGCHEGARWATSEWAPLGSCVLGRARGRPRCWLNLRDITECYAALIWSAWRRAHTAWRGLGRSLAAAERGDASPGHTGQCGRGSFRSFVALHDDTVRSLRCVLDLGVGTRGPRIAWAAMHTRACAATGWGTPCLKFVAPHGLRLPGDKGDERSTVAIGRCSAPARRGDRGGVRGDLGRWSGTAG